MSNPAEVYPLTLRDGRWWLPYGPEADAEMLASVFRSDSLVVFLWPEGGSFAFDVTDEGAEVVRVNYGAWTPLEDVTLLPWQGEAYWLVQDAIDCM